MIDLDIWKKDCFKLFISHLAKNKAEANELKINLNQYGISSFVAHTDIEPSHEWQNTIEYALNTCDALIAMMTKSFKDSRWVDQEIGYVYGQDKLIIPIRMGTDPYGFIGKFQAISYKEIELIGPAVFKILNKNSKTCKEIASSIMSKFENSDTFAEAKKNLKLVEQINYWDERDCKMNCAI
jgi:hypothetical protein